LITTAYIVFVTAVKFIIVKNMYVTVKHPGSPNVIPPKPL